MAKTPLPRHSNSDIVAYARRQVRINANGDRTTREFAVSIPVIAFHALLATLFALGLVLSDPALAKDMFRFLWELRPSI